MQKVTIINLNGKAYQLDESGYEALRAYLDAAARELDGNPDKTEIMADLEQAVAEKCARYVSGAKTVVSADEVKAIIAEMGPVTSDESGRKSDAAGTSESAASASAPKAAGKRLYRIKEDSIIAGVCTGLAAYFDIDVILVRLIFIILTIITHGAGVLVYLVMAIAVPKAETLDEVSAAHGAAPISAREFIGRAKKNYADFKDSKEWRQWKRQLHEQAHSWKQEWRKEKWQWKQERDAWRDEHRYHARRHGGLAETIWSVFSLVIIVFGCWYGYQHVTLIREFFDAVSNWWQSLMDNIVANWH